MNGTEDSEGKLVVAKLLHASFLASILVYVTLLMRLSSLDIAPLLAGDPLLNVAIWILACLAVASVALWYYWPRLMSKAYERNRQKWRKLPNPIFWHVVRISFIQSVAIYGLVLGVLGAGWAVTVPFFAVALITMAFTFPTKGKWDKASMAF